jgi:hypothetical protein
MSRNVSVSSGPVKYSQSISVGPHKLQSGEPPDFGGKDIGPNAQELLMASLGACATITVKCMPRGISGLLRVGEPCRRRESLLRILRIPVCRLEWWTSSRWSFPWWEIYPQSSGTDCLR